MTCEILNKVRKIKRNPRLQCDEECLIDHICLYASDDVAFPRKEVDTKSLKGYIEEVVEKISQ